MSRSFIENFNQSPSHTNRSNSSYRHSSPLKNKYCESHQQMSPNPKSRYIDHHQQFHQHQHHQHQHQHRHVESPNSSPFFFSKNRSPSVPEKPYEHKQKSTTTTESTKLKNVIQFLCFFIQALCSNQIYICVEFNAYPSNYIIFIKAV